MNEPMEMGPEATPEDEAAMQAANIARIESLGVTLAHKRQKAIDARVSSGIDQRWYEDVEAYEGRDSLTRTYAGLRETVQGYVTSVTKTQPQSTLVVNVTRSKVNAGAARLIDIALPTDDRNWNLRHSTNPELVAKMAGKDVDGLTQNGAPVMVTENGQQRQATTADLAKLDDDNAKKAAEAMRDEIDDQLDISNDGAGFEGVVRAVMFDESQLGVGVAKGPVVSSRTKNVWMPITDGQKTVHVMQRVQDLKPGSSRVNPWDIYPHPDCGENPKKFPIWERIPGVTAADIRGYVDIPGYLKDQIVKVLTEGPKKPDQPANKPGENASVSEDTVYEAWEYHGDLDRDDLIAAGCECSENDLFNTYSATVIMINNTVIKADIEMLDTGEMPYDFFVTEKCSGAWAGYGVSFLARSAQKAITAGWRAMLNHAGWFGGPQIVVNRKEVVPADGKWELRGPKMYWYTGSDPSADMGKMFAVHQISSNQGEFANIIKMGMEFLDSETALPQLVQGEMGKAPDVLGITNSLLNASNVLTRRKLKCFDDQFTIPHIGRYVDWNMQYNENPEIKGDFEVLARASGALMDTEIQNNSANDLMAIALNPQLAHGMKKWDAVRRVVRARRFDPDDFVKSDAEIDAAEKKMQEAGAPPDPRVQVAQIRAEADAKIEAQRLQFEQQDNERERQNKQVIAAINERMNSTQLSSAERQNLEKIRATLGGDAIKLRAQAAMQQQEHAAQLLKPPVEPKGRAPNGRAFTQ